MKKTVITLSLLFCTIASFGCSCSRAWNDSFSRTINKSEVVVLIKILSFDEYLDFRNESDNSKIPHSMTAEIIKNYKGNEKREKIKIWGDNGMLCRKYLSSFKINNYYLVAPNPLNNEVETDYEILSCQTNYLNVDMTSNIAIGKYSPIRYKIDLDDFEDKIKNGDWDFVKLGMLSCFIIVLLFIIRNKRHNKKLN